MSFMEKIIIKESDIKLLVSRILNEGVESPFQLNTPEMKLEFLITRLNDVINDINNEGNGDMVYYGNRLSNILNIVNGNVNESKKQNKFDKVMREFGKGKLKTSAGDKVTDQKQAVAIAYSESGLNEKSENIVNESLIKKIVENVLNEWRPRTGYDEWANLETGGAHGRGIQNRRNFTRKENSKGEESTPLQTKTDFIQLILKVDPYNDEVNGKIFNVIIKRYKNKILTLGDIHLITEISQIKNTPIGQRLIQFVDSENEVTHFYPPNFREKDVSNKQQPK